VIIGDLSLAGKHYTKGTIAKIAGRAAPLWHNTAHIPWREAPGREERGLEPYGLAVLRLMTGVVFMAHGAQKLFGIWGGGGLSGTEAYFAQIGLAPAFALAVLAGLTEFVGGLMLVLGAFTVIAAGLLTVMMVVAMWKVHLANGFFLNWAITPGVGHGVEYNLVLVAALVCLMLTGPGEVSIDWRRARSAEALAAGRARLRAGKV
jgi:putative oxidoreductase